MLFKSEELHQILENFKSCAPLFIALGDTSRQELILNIAEAGTEGLNVTNLSAKSKLSRPAISHHLKVLKDTGLILPFKNGTQIFYKLNLSEDLKKIENLVNSMQNVIKKLDSAEKKVQRT